MKITRIITLPILLAMLLIGATLQAQELGDTVIRTNTTWSGSLTIKGVVVVARGATLTISPGTKIAFKKVDRNHDAIGDSEIRVLGRILAKGSKEAPIQFSSAEAEPAPKDWSYLLIFTSGQVNEVRYCQFRHGFSGLQVQFSTAIATDNLFENNHEGIRFGRAKLTLKHNTFSNNDLGVRFTRMEGPMEMLSNDIHHNRIGVFLVPSGQNIQDFFEPGRAGIPWNQGHLMIQGNNIYANTDYNLNLGAKQKWDLQISGNWWGEQSEEAIRQKIFDHRMDDRLGQAIIQPLAQEKITKAGIR